MRRVLWLGRALLIVVSLIVITASLAILGWFILDDETAEKYTAGQSPTLYSSGPGDDLLDDYAGVFGVAHNSGDSLNAARRAVGNGADIIEIDVVSIDGKLYAAHDQPVRRVGSYVFRGPTLSSVWEAAAQAEVVKLDLKEASPAFIDLVVEFVNARQDRQVIVAARQPESLRVFEEQAPQVYRLLSLSTPSQLAELRADPEALELIDGVTARERLLEDDAVAWLQEQNLMILAWTINDYARLNELVALGVDGVTTDNLTMLELLGGQERGEALLAHAEARRGQRLLQVAP